MKYVFVVTAYNAEKWIKKCIDSIKTQIKTNWICILCDDCSSDKTFNVMKTQQTPDFFLYRSNKNMGAAYMRYNSVKHFSDHIDDEDVILLIGGDDWLAHNKVLNILQRAYDNGACVTYGNYKSLQNNNFHSLAEFPKSVIKERSFRSHPWISTAINTFKYKLFKLINPEHLKDPKGIWMKNCTDLAIMFPILEMAPNDTIKPIHHIIYIYNNKLSSNTLSRFGKNHKTMTNKYIRRLPKYQQIIS